MSVRMFGVLTAAKLGGAGGISPGRMVHLVNMCTVQWSLCWHRVQITPNVDTWDLRRRRVVS